MNTTKVRARFRKDEIVLPPWPFWWWILMLFMSLMACVVVLPVMLAFPVFIALLATGQLNVFGLVILGLLAALPLCLIHDLIRGDCVLMNWPGGTFIHGYAAFLFSGDMLNVLFLGRARYVLRRKEVDGRWILELERHWPFGWTQRKFTRPLDRVGPIGHRISMDRGTDEPENLPTSSVYFGDWNPHPLELLPADATVVAERLQEWEQEALSSLPGRSGRLE